MLRFRFFPAILLVAATPAMAQQSVKLPTGYAPGQAVGFGAVESAFVPVTPATPLPVDGGRTVIASSQFTTPAGSAGYASGQLVANAGIATAVVPVSLAACRADGGAGMIRRVRLFTTDRGFAGATLRVHFHQDAPTYAGGDHAAWLTSSGRYLVAFDVVLDRAFSDGVAGIGGAPASGSEVNFACADGARVVYAGVEARGPVTPQGGQRFVVAAEVLAD